MLNEIMKSHTADGKALPNLINLPLGFSDSSKNWESIRGDREFAAMENEFWAEKGKAGKKHHVNKNGNIKNQSWNIKENGGDVSAHSSRGAPGRRDSPGSPAAPPLKASALLK